MVAKIEFFPVDNGDMTLVTLESGRKIIIDVNIRKAADDKNDTTTDVAALLRKRLDRDGNGRLFIDAFLLTHPDEDHCRGLSRHFHLGKPEDWKKADDKILIREMWSSPMIFRRKKEVQGALCDDAEAWWTEARRRANLYKATAIKSSIVDGNRIQVLGEDKDGNTDTLTDILVKSDTEITKICGQTDNTFSAWLLAPHLLNKADEDALTGKNHSSTILRFSIKGGTKSDACLFLTGGDAEVENWERIWNRNKARKNRLEYDLLQAPHHCSWHSLSYDSWSDKKEKAKVSDAARSALSQVKSNAFIVSSSKEIKDDDIDPPCIRAKREYQAILKGVAGTFLCTATECEKDVLLFEIGTDGPKKGKPNSNAPSGLLGSSTPKMTEKDGGGRYA